MDKEIAARKPQPFCILENCIKKMVEQQEPCEARVSRTVL